MADVERMCTLLENLSTSDDIHSNLVALKTELGALSLNDLRFVVNGANFNPVFQCLSSTPNRDEVDICCSILERLMTALSNETLWTDFSEYLLKGLDHSYSSVQMLSLNVFMRLIESHSNQLCESCEFLCKLVSLLASDDDYVAGQTSKILTVIGRKEEHLEALYAGVVFDTLQNIMKLSDTIRYRVMQVVLSVSCTSSSALFRTWQVGLLASLLADLNKNDVLVQLNCVELLTNLALCPHGLAFLDERGIVAMFMKALITARNDQISALILPSLVKFFGNISHVHAKDVFTKYPYFVDLLLELIVSDDTTLSGLAIDTVGFIGSTSHGKMAFSNIANKMESCLGHLSQLVHSAPSDIKVKTLHTIATLLHIPVEEQNSELLDVTHHWFTLLKSSDMLHQLMSICRQPFPDLRGAALSILSSLAGLPWGQQKLLAYPGFQEYLVDRSTEVDKSGKEGKFEIIKTLANSPTFAHNANATFVVKVKGFYKEGPFYVAAQAEVALDRDS